MKECPFCKAALEDTAQFCLYCMKPLTEKATVQPLGKKKSRWLLVLALVLVVGVAVALWLLARPGSTASADAAPAGQEAGAPKVPEASPADVPALAPVTEPQDTATADQTTPAQTQGATPGGNWVTPSQPVPGQSTGTIPATENTQPPATGSTQPATGSTQPATGQPATQSPSQPEATQPPATQPTTQPTKPATTQTTQAPEPEPVQPPASSSIYQYRLANAGDDFSASYANPGSDIVITGVLSPTSDGVYHIPAYIDGQKVMGIGPNAFNGSGARVIYLPSTLKTVQTYGFYGCPLAHIYFTHNVYISPMAISGRLTFHCPKSTGNRDLRQYSACSETVYGCSWEEWNG